MNRRNSTATVFVLVATGLIIHFFLTNQIRVEFETYFKAEYYLKFSTVILSAALLNAGILLFRNRKQTNLAMAVFGYMILEEILFDLLGVTSSDGPLIITLILLGCALPAIWIAHTNAFQTQKLSYTGLIISLIIGAFESLLPILI